MKLGEVGEYVCCEVIYVVFDVEDEDVAECLGRVWWVAKQVIQLLERSRWVGMHVYQCLIMQCNAVKLVLGPRRHVGQCALRTFNVIHLQLDRSFEVECLQERSLAQCLAVTNATDVIVVRRGSHGQLWVVTHTLVDDFVDETHRTRKLAHLEVTQGDVIREVGRVTELRRGKRRRRRRRRRKGGVVGGKRGTKYRKGE